jgi:serine-type D-Ala-D-Ala carboxypeptidase/endopeptidase
MSKIVPPTEKYLDSLVEPFLQNQSSGLAFVIGYVGPGFHDIYFKGNLANQFGKKLPLDQDTYFEVASISKTFTATLCVALGRKFQAAWESQFIQNYNGTGGLGIGAQFNPIPLPSLLNYTSGLPPSKAGLDFPPELPTPYTAAGMLGYLGMTTLQPKDIGTAYSYSNLAFSILAQILPMFRTSAALPDFTSLMSELVLGPLGMNDTQFFEDISIDEFALGYSYQSSQTKPEPVAPGWEFFDAYYGAGGVVSTPKDMLAWLRFNMGRIDDSADKALRKCLPVLQSPSTTVTRNGTQLGLSWLLEPSSKYPPEGAVWKDGELLGTNTYIIFLPWVETDSPSKAGVFVMTNCNNLLLDNTQVVAAIANDVLLTMQGITPPEDKSGYPSTFGS